MKHINQVEVTIPEESDEFLENATGQAERCVSAGGLAQDFGLLRGTPRPSEPKAVLKLEVAFRLRRAREQAGLTIGQADELLGLDPGTVGEIESGGHSVAVEELPKLAETYGVDMTWLIEPGLVKPHHDRLALAARELNKLKGEDLERVIDLLSSLQSRGEGVK
jgi:transcriptional regulator with XRE-family HTH domain